MSGRGRWFKLLLGPALAVVIICAPFAIASQVPNIPTKTATQILASVAKAEKLTGYSGMIQQVSNLGLPDLSNSLTGASTSGAASTDPLTQAVTLLSSNQRLHVSMSHAGARVQLYKTDGEQDVVLNNGNLWLWDYKTQTVTHVKLPTISTTAAKKLAAVNELLTSDKPLYTPQGLASDLIAGLDSHTRTSVGQSRYVAGRAAYMLVFTPREAHTLVGSIQVAVDAETGLPLQFSVYAKGNSSPAYQLGYTAISYSRPTAAAFAFTPPPHTKVKTLDYTTPALRDQLTKLTQATPTSSNPTLTTVEGILGGVIGVSQQVHLTGTGWASIITLPAGTVDVSSNKLLKTLTNAGTGGNLTLSTTLLNIVFKKNGAVELGAAPLSYLQ